MLDLARCEDAQLDLVRRVATNIRATSPGMEGHRIMLVGAACRDVLQSALGHGFALRATRDLDVAIALSEWGDFRDLTSRLTKVDGASNGIRYNISGLPVDLMPFGDVEDPTGIVTPRPRNEGMSVWAFREVFEHSVSLPLNERLAVRLPSVPGYAALKLAAWLDRVQYYEYKDATDIAAAVFWYGESDAVADRLYETESGMDILTTFEMDLAVAAAHLLGRDIQQVIGPDRHKELASRWPSNREDMLLKQMNLTYASAWAADTGRRRALLHGLEAGLGL